MPLLEVSIILSLPAISMTGYGWLRLIRARREKAEVLSMRNDARGCHDVDVTGTDRTASSKDDMISRLELERGVAQPVRAISYPGSLGHDTR